MFSGTSAMPSHRCKSIGIDSYPSGSLTLRPCQLSNGPGLVDGFTDMQARTACILPTFIPCVLPGCPDALRYKCHPVACHEGPKAYVGALRGGSYHAPYGTRTWLA